ncbi:MAG: hypothetical protein KF833_00210 [Verrucomicrobiae bacterium]|nr:hypothetical protein [Verrucomicrobiae bacterium]
MMAQASNVMLFLNLALPPGYSLIGNPLLGADERVGEVLRGVPAGTELWTWSDGSFVEARFDGGEWDQPAQRLRIGEGAFLLNPQDEPMTVTLTGGLAAGRRTNSIPAGLSMRSALHPISGRLTTDLGLKLLPLDNVYLWRDGRFEVYTYLPGDAWHPEEPRLSRGEGFFIRAEKALEWVTEVDP